MSLLDVLRYPISNSVTSDQLKALPGPLLRAWMILVHWADDAVETMAKFYRDDTGYRSLSHDRDLALLRRMIYELV